ncbi:MAG: sigma-70 family RNA polymerase sigma factor [Gammaproteobacteria bacterium]
MSKEKERALDAYLVASARVGNRNAWRRLVERWQPRFLGHAYRLTGDAELARDAAQDAWAEVLRGLAGLDDVVAFPAWALRIVGRRCARLVNKQVKWRATEAALAREPDTAPEQSDSAQRDLQLTAVRGALHSLSTEQRTAIGLFYLEEMSVAEVAVVLDVPIGTVKTRLMHARRKLRAQLETSNEEN